MKNAPLAIPEILVGRYPTVRQRCRKLARRAVELGDIAAAAAELPFISIEDAPGEIILDRPSKVVEMEHVVPWPVFNEIVELSVILRPDDNYDWHKSLLWPALDSFWFHLAILSEGGSVVPWRTADHREDPVRREDCRYILNRMVRWWPAFCALENRFVDGYLQPEDRWTRGTWSLLHGMGQQAVIEELKQLDAEGVGERLRELVDNVD